MTEPVAVGRVRRVDDEQLRFDRRAEARGELRAGQAADLGKDVVPDLAPGHGRDLDQVAGVLLGLTQPDEQDAAQGVRQAIAGTDRGIRRRDQLLGEERVAVRAARDRIEERRARGRADDARQQLGQRSALESREVEAIHAGLPFRLGQPGRERMATMELVRPERADDAQPLVARVAPQEGEQVARRPVGPVEVLDDEQDRVGPPRAGRAG